MAHRKEYVGASLVTRDGLVVLQQGQAFSASETFGAMAAAIYGAAEVSFETALAARSLLVAAETDRGKFVIVGAGEEMLLILLAASGTATAEVVTDARRYAAMIAAAPVEVRR